MSDNQTEEVLQPIAPPKTRFIGQGLGIVFNLYVAIALVIFAPYYNWQYATENGFVKWIFLGEIVPTAKAAVWPYFVFFNKSKPVILTDAEKDAINHFSASLHAEVAANEMMSVEKNRTDIEKVTQILGLKKTAFQEAQLVDDNMLDKIHPDLKGHFKDEYAKYIALQIQCFENPKPENERLLHQADELATKWENWYNKNSSEFGKGLN